MWSCRELNPDARNVESLHDANPAPLVGAVLVARLFFYSI